MSFRTDELQRALRRINRELAQAEDALETRRLAPFQRAEIASRIHELVSEQDAVLDEIDALDPGVHP